MEDNIPDYSCNNYHDPCIAYMDTTHRIYEALESKRFPNPNAIKLFIY